MAVAQIAKNHLSDQGHSGSYDKFNELVTIFNSLSDGKSTNFVEAAAWADDIKSYNAKIFDSYHFINIVYDPTHMFKGMTDFQRDINIVNQMGWCMKVLNTNKNGITFERAWMARYLIHLAGDIHQPLHTTMMYNSTFPNGDLGGM